MPPRAVPIPPVLHFYLFETKSSEALCLLGRARTVSILRSQAGSDGLDGISDCKVNPIIPNIEGCAILSRETCKEHVRQCEFAAIPNIKIQNISSSTKLIHHQYNVFIIFLSLPKKKEKLNERYCWKVHNFTSSSLTSFPKLQ